MSTYDEWKSSEPENEYADERELDHREEQDERAAHPERYDELEQCVNCQELDSAMADIADSQQQHLANLREIERLLGVK